jgi:hypothetical protein
MCFVFGWTERIHELDWCFLFSFFLVWFRLSDEGSSSFGFPFSGLRESKEAFGCGVWVSYDVSVLLACVGVVDWFISSYAGF